MHDPVLSTPHSLLPSQAALSHITPSPAALPPLAGVVAHASPPAVAAANGTPAATPAAPPAAAADGLADSSFTRFLATPPSAFNGPASHSLRLSDTDVAPGVGVEKSERSQARSELSSGLSMLGSSMPSFDVMQRMRKSLSPEELQAAFARR